MSDCLLLTGADGYVGQRLRDRLASNLEVVGVSPALEAHRRNVLHLYAHLVAEQGRALGVRDIRSEQSRFHGALALVGGTNELLIEHLTQAGHEHPAMDALTEDIVGVYIAVGRFS